MVNSATSLTIEHPFHNVKPSLNTQLPLFPASVRHHSNTRTHIIRGNIDKVRRETSYYGVSPDHRLLANGVFDKRFDQIVHCLRDVVALPTGQREAILRLLRIWRYYGKVYPKASQIAAEPGCSKATFWRAVMHLKKLGLIRVIPRILDPLRRQISDLFILHKLLLVIARYLAEHGCPFTEKWLRPYLAMPGSQFWPSMLIGSSPGLSPGLTGGGIIND